MKVLDLGAGIGQLINNDVIDYQNWIISYNTDKKDGAYKHVSLLDLSCVYDMHFDLGYCASTLEYITDSNTRIAILNEFSKLDLDSLIIKINTNKELKNYWSAAEWEKQIKLIFCLFETSKLKNSIVFKCHRV